MSDQNAQVMSVAKRAVLVERFNRDHPVGTPVLFWPWTRQEAGRPSKTRSEAWLMGGHTPVVLVEGYSGGIALSHVEVVQGG